MPCQRSRGCAADSVTFKRKSFMSVSWSSDGGAERETSLRNQLWSVKLIVDIMLIAIFYQRYIKPGIRDLWKSIRSKHSWRWQLTAGVIERRKRWDWARRRGGAPTKRWRGRKAPR